MKVRRQFFAGCSALVATAALASPDTVIGEPYEIKASWQENAKDIEPVGVDFRFQALSTTSGNGILALADSLILRIEDERPFVTLGIRTSRLEPAPTFLDAVSLPDGSLLLSSSSPIDAGASDDDAERGFLAKWSEGSELASFPMPPNRNPKRPWRLPRLANSPDGKVFALVNSNDTPPFNDPKISPEPVGHESGLFELVGERWREIPFPYVGAPYFVSDFCVVGGNDLWIVGSTLSIREDGTISGRSGFAANRSGGDWALFTVPAPEKDPLAWNLDRLACRPGAPVYATGLATDDPERVSKFVFDGVSVVYATDGTRWHQQPTPEVIEKNAPRDVHSGQRVVASAVDDLGRLWIAASEPLGKNAALLTLNAGEWTRHELPRVPTVSDYAPSHIVFDRDGRGWATSNRLGNATTPESRGILLRYDGEQWKHQGWKWNRFRQRGFGLLGGSLR